MTAEDDLRREVRHWLKVNGVRQSSVAAVLGFSQKHVSDVLLGKARLSVELAEAMLDTAGRRLVVTSVPAGGPDGRYYPEANVIDVSGLSPAQTGVLQAMIASWSHDEA